MGKGIDLSNKNNSIKLSTSNTSFQDNKEVSVENQAISNSSPKYTSTNTDENLNTPLSNKSNSNPFVTPSDSRSGEMKDKFIYRKKYSRCFYKPIVVSSFNS